MTEAHNKSREENPIHSTLPEPLPSFPGVPANINHNIITPYARFHTKFTTWLTAKNS